MKLHTTAPAPPATAEALAEQALSEEAQASSQVAARDALREALPSRSAGEGSSRTARRSGGSILRSIASTSAGGSAHASLRTQALAVRQSEDVQIQDDGTEESIALPQQLDGAIADWASEMIDQATVRPGDDAELLTRPSHQRVTRDGRRQQPRGQQHQPHEQSHEHSQEQQQEHGKQEARPAADDDHDGAQTVKNFADGSADQAFAGGHMRTLDSPSDSPWNPHSRARSTARIAPLAAAVPAHRQVDELDSQLAASKSNSDVVSAVLWALAAMVLVIVSTLLLTLFSNDTTEPASEPAVVHPTPHDAPLGMQKKHEADPSHGRMSGRASNV
jgi:hypothetical protein